MMTEEQSSVLTTATTTMKTDPQLTSLKARLNNFVKELEEDAEEEEEEDEVEVAAEPKPPPPPIIVSANAAHPTIVVNGRHYQNLRLIGKGGSSKVYQVFDHAANQTRAIKVVDLSDADEQIRVSYEREIKLLAELKRYSGHIVQLYDWEKRPAEQKLYVVMEAGDTDLAALLKGKRRLGGGLSDKMIAFYWEEMLTAVKIIHEEKNIVHLDLKPSNFLLVGGQLKLIDFGIASKITSDKTAVTRESQMGTLNYMSPEAINWSGDDASKIKVSTKADVWSLGCILYYMVYAKTPFQHVTNPAMKMMAIVSEKHSIPFGPIADEHLLDAMKRCLQREPAKRLSVRELLQHPYATSWRRDRKPQRALMLEDEQLLAAGRHLAVNSPNTNARILRNAFRQIQAGQAPTFDAQQT